MVDLLPLHRLDPERFETAAILKGLAAASRPLAEFKGVAASLPNPRILLSALGLREAKDSSAIENIVTTHDELFRFDLRSEAEASAAAKEVAGYRRALWTGFETIREAGLIANRHILDIHALLEGHRGGFRRVPGTTLRDGTGRVVYVPPSPERVPELMSDLERFVNDLDSPIDPLIRMALIHHRFESIHPFYDGNGRTGRILNVLYLVHEGLLDLPVLYPSRHIVRTKARYYDLLRQVQVADQWEAWVLYMLEGVEETARDGVRIIGRIRDLYFRTKQTIREGWPSFYSRDLVHNLFEWPYTKISLMQAELGVSRLTATRYLDRLAEAGVLEKRRVGRTNYYVNVPLVEVLTEDR
jgi:Fic family protein